MLIFQNKTLLILFLLVIISSSTILADDILDFYVNRANNTFQSRDPFAGGLNFSYQVNSYYKKIVNDRNAVLVDSSDIVYYYSFGELDSTKTIHKAEDYSDNVNLSFSNLFSEDYIFDFFPNDTGGSDLAIAFDTYDFDERRPVGFAVIDRERYFLRWMYLYNVNDRKDKRKSRWLKFTEHEGFIFPDSIWEIKAIRAVFSTNYYRIESGITNITIYR